MDSHGPALRTREDLEVFERDSEKERCFIIKDPVLRTYHRLGSLAYAVLEALEQGGEPGEPLRERLRAAHGIDVPAADLARVVDQLARLSLFEVTPEQALRHGEPSETVMQLVALR